MKTLLHICFAATALAIPAVAQTDTPAPGTDEKQPAAPRANTGTSEARDNKKATHDTPMNPATEVEFIITAAKNGMKEVKMAQLAAGKAIDPKIRELAQMMVNDHTTANSDLKTAADALKVELPEGPKDKTQDAKTQDVEDKAPGQHQAEQKHEELSNLTGKEFDSAFLDHMAAGHKNSIAFYEAGRKVAKSPGVIAFIEKTLPVIRNHAEKIKQAQTGTAPAAPRTPVSLRLSPR